MRSKGCRRQDVRFMNIRFGVRISEGKKHPGKIHLYAWNKSVTNVVIEVFILNVELVDINDPDTC